MGAKILFDAGVDKYDQQRSMVIPCFNDFYQTAVNLIPFDRPDSFTFLDLGAGTGLLASFIINLFPDAKGTLIDVSEKMMGKAMERFSSNKRISFLESDYSNNPLPGQYDLIVSAMSIHHLSDEEKKLLYQRVYDGLTNRGVFINADLAKGETVNTERNYQTMWMDWIKEAGLGEEELSGIIERMGYDRPSLLGDQLQWLKNIGFLDVDCYYKYYNFAVFSGVK
ncbi:MAG: class I SAM-dependent methyltransferase [Thermodesulfobacteriota bacterium]|nr:class I SAM-dependent methyltransferase [Thermodesulfobacteriota bacterium]